ncbi:MAG: DUF1559 domain-containing protein [Planctomycetia bacterium]|nr:DUF1559 domain-containing protein [Planctomycetia bacterium]
MESPDKKRTLTQKEATEVFMKYYGYVRGVAFASAPIASLSEDIAHDTYIFDTPPTRGFFGNGYGECKSAGHPSCYNCRSTSDLIDGLSNTVALSEAVTARDFVDPRVKGGLQQSFDINSWGYEANVCAAKRSTDDPKLYATPATNPATRPRGSGFQFGFPTNFLFNTILPPNSPSCHRGTDGMYGGFLSATSEHNGGANALKADGSVVFISDTIDCGTLSSRPSGSPFSTADFSGESPFGIWGAMGTIVGGESRSL